MLADVRKLDGHHVARSDPGVVEPRGDRCDARFQLRVGDGPLSSARSAGTASYRCDISAQAAMS